MSTPDFPSLSAMHRAVCMRLGSLPALRFKRHGIWSGITWEEYREEADLAGGGLIAHGIAPGDRVGILSENRFEFLVADHGILSAGAVPVPVYPTSAPPQIQYLLAHSGARGLFVSGAGQLEKVVPLLPSLPELKFIVSFDSLDPLQSFHSLKRSGARCVEELRAREAALKPDSPAAIIYTSGTTGVPKGAMLTHGGLLFTSGDVAGVLGYNSSCVMLSWLPYCHVFARCVDHYTSTRMGMAVALAESPQTVFENLAEIEPHYFTSVPRVLEKAWTQISSQPPEKRGEEARKIFGRRLDFLTSGGGPLPLAVARGLCEAGVPVREGYGMTESSSVIAFNRRDRWKTGTVGPAIAGIETRLAPDGELLTRGPHVMTGYWRNPAATAEALEEGWLHTGDLAAFDEEGFLKITGRKKDLIITAGGENISPSGLEALLVSDPFIEQAVAYGDGKPFITAIIAPKPGRLAEAAREAGVVSLEDGDVIHDPRLVRWFQARVDMIMRAVSQPERVKKIVLLNRLFSQDREEMTLTQKVRRSAVVHHYQAELDALYQQSTA